MSEQGMSVDSEFRPDIEGLRALAILAVLAFHYEGAPFFAGGYIGVDVFFVISGYLITKNVFTQASYGDFLFRDFYIRRAGRLIPALFFIIVLTLVGGICISSPADLKHIGESAIASIFSVSNIYFWSQAGYFDTSAIQKPLLHTWALSVEWQFYLLWPAVVVLLVRYLKNYKYAIVALGAMGVLSFFAAELVMGRDAPGAFYLTPYRIGEFALGAIFALIPLLRSNLLWIRNGLVLLGFSLIFFAVFGYSETTRFPGVAALIPCVGAVLLIRFGEHSIASPVMTNRFVVGLGRVSYSLYLVHWPLYVFARQWYGSDFGLGGNLPLASFH